MRTNHQTGKHKDNRRQNKGFTLVEILIVVAIIGVLAAITLPSFQDKTRKANRTDGFAMLNEIMQSQERFAAEGGTYTVNLTDLGYLATQPSPSGWYNITADTCEDAAGGAVAIAQCVLLIATPQNEQVGDINHMDGVTPKNRPMTFNSRGLKVGWRDAGKNPDGT